MKPRRAGVAGTVLDALGDQGHAPHAVEPGCWRATCPACSTASLTVREVQWNDGRPKARLDCSRGCPEHDVLAALGLTPGALRAPKVLSSDEHLRPGGQRLAVRRASEITAREVQWLWEHRIPLGKLTLLAGLAGQGKSLFTVDLAARTTRGELDGSLHGEPASVLLITGEDDPQDTIKPRLIAAGADDSRVLFVDRTDEHGIRSALELPRDAELLAETIEEHAVRLVVVDPVVTFLDDAHDAHKTQKVRRALQPLQEAAQRLGCAVLLVLHPNKTQSNDPSVKIGESYAFQALARSVLVLGPDPHDPEGERGSRKALAVAKSNLAPPGTHGVGFEIASAWVNGADGPIATEHLRQLGPVDVDARDLLGGQAAHGRLDDAIEWLREALAAGPRGQREVAQAASAAGFSAATLRRAKQSLSAESVRVDGIAGDGSWQWRLPAPLDEEGAA
jgi:putative DNA primase/helicase